MVWTEFNQEVYIMYRIREESGVKVVAIENTLREESVNPLKEKLNSFLEDGKSRIVLDMLKADYITSIGLSMIVTVNKKAQMQGGGVKLACISRLMKNLLESTKLDRIISVYDTVDEAIESFR
ncbi:MAG: STAS domain-containing protein [Chitinivibrionales bacterium]